MNRPLPESLCHVARLGLRNAKADGYAIDQLTDDGAAWLRKHAEGLSVPREGRSDLVVFTFPLGTEDTETGALSFVFQSRPVSGDAERVLAQIATASQAIWRTWHAHAAYARSVIRIAEVEAELADSKIADRACALLEMGGRHENPVDTISRSVATVTSPYQLGPVLKKLVQDLERDVAEYELVRQAKGVLQDRQGMSEAQAYLHLRQVSRQSRRPLWDVAGELIEFGFVRPRQEHIRRERRIGEVS